MSDLIGFDTEKKAEKRLQDIVNGITTDNKVLLLQRRALRAASYTITFECVLPADKAVKFLTALLQENVNNSIHFVSSTDMIKESDMIVSVFKIEAIVLL